MKPFWIIFVIWNAIIRSDALSIAMSKLFIMVLIFYIFFFFSLRERKINPIIKVKLEILYTTHQAIKL